MNQHSVERAAHLLGQARQIVALTGAGISQPSGIPDFRGDAGLWHRYDPIQVASLRGFQANPLRFFDWFRPLLATIQAAQPNPAHLALVALERTGRLKAVITQNIDGLHQRAGSREVFELHGHLRSATCLDCERQVPLAALLGQIRRGKLPRCACGGVFKPDVVLFDEMLPRGLYWLAHRELATCDALIVAGTALEVAPVCEMPATVLQRGGRLIIVNQSETHLDHYADVTLHADAAVALPAIIEQLQIADRMLQIG